MNRPVAWITGAGGLIGSHITRLAETLVPEWDARGLTRPQLDLTDAIAVRRRFAEERPALVIHCAAMTRTPDCERHPALARQVNLEATTLLAELTAGIGFYFLSTDLVFDGRKGNYAETDPVNPLSTYAETKAAAEEFVLRNPGHTVIRTSLNAGRSPTGDRSFTEDMHRAWSAGRTLKFFVDEFRSPIPASITARAVWHLVQGRHAGLYHVAGAERLSRWEIGRQVAACWPEFQPRFEAGSLRDYEGPPRAPDTSLNCTKAQAALSFPLPRFSDWVAAHREDMV